MEELARAGVWREPMQCLWRQQGQELPPGPGGASLASRNLAELHPRAMSVSRALEFRQWGRNCCGLGSLPSPPFLLPWQGTVPALASPGTA